MIFTSTKYKRLYISEDTLKEKCPNCEKERTLHIEITNKVYYFQGIPSFAFHKKALLSCSFCRTSFDVKHFKKYEKSCYEILKKTQKKWYSYLGIVLIILVILGLSTFLKFTDNDEGIKENIENLRKNDVIFYALGEEQTSMIVSRIKNDTIFVYENKLTTNKHVYSIDKYGNYFTKETFYLKSVLKQKLENKIINIY